MAAVLRDVLYTVQSRIKGLFFDTKYYTYYTRIMMYEHMIQLYHSMSFPGRVLHVYYVYHTVSLLYYRMGRFRPPPPLYHTLHHLHPPSDTV